MGDRISIAFKNSKEKEKSVALFSHWDGEDLVKSAENYLKNLKEWLKKRNSSINDPIQRLEPNTVMVDFIRHYLPLEDENDHIDGNYYLGKNENDGDNSDNGHFDIDINT